MSVDRDPRRTSTPCFWNTLGQNHAARSLARPAAKGALRSPSLPKNEPPTLR